MRTHKRYALETRVFPFLFIFFFLRLFQTNYPISKKHQESALKPLKNHHETKTKCYCTYLYVLCGVTLNPTNERYRSFIPSAPVNIWHRVCVLLVCTTQIRTYYKIWNYDRYNVHNTIQIKLCLGVPNV